MIDVKIQFFFNIWEFFSCRWTAGEFFFPFFYSFIISYYSITGRYESIKKETKWKWNKIQVTIVRRIITMKQVRILSFFLSIYVSFFFLHFDFFCLVDSRTSYYLQSEHWKVMCTPIISVNNNYDWYSHIYFVGTNKNLNQKKKKNDSDFNDVHFSFFFSNPITVTWIFIHSFRLFLSVRQIRYFVDIRWWWWNSNFFKLNKILSSGSLVHVQMK